MRTIILTTLLLTYLALKLNAQTDFAALDRANYQFFLDKDYKNLKKNSKLLLEQGSDYYYLRVRLGILAYERQRYASAYQNLKRAKQLNPFDTISNEYLYYSFLLAGRTADAKHFLRSLSEDQKNSQLKTLSLSEDPELNVGYSFMDYEVEKYQTNPLNYEAVENISVFNASMNFNFTPKSRGFLQYSNTRKVATFYSSSNPTGEYGTFSQNQVYFRYKNLISPGWEIAGYTHWVFFSTEANTSTFGRRSSSLSLSTQSLFGLNISHSGWYLRGGLNLNYSNFENSSQFATEGYLTYLPFSNLNLYSTISGFYQIDKNWGNSYQANFDVGFKVFKYLWLESGAMVGNSFLYSRSLGTVLNNSFIIPATNFYGTIIIPARKFSLRIGGNYSSIYNYSWDLVNYTKTSKLVLDSFGVNATLTIKFQ